MEGGEKTANERRRESHAKREQPSGESSMHYKCCEIVGSSGILRMNGFYCSVLITDCCYSSSSFYCICAVVDRVLMMMVMIMTLLATRWSNENKTEIIALFFYRSEVVNDRTILVRVRFGQTWRFGEVRPNHRTFRFGQPNHHRTKSLHKS